MKALVVYESMYGNTHEIAEAIADGLRHTAEVSVLPVRDAPPAAADDVDLVVVGGPTHAHAMTRASTRQAAVEAARKPAAGLTLEPDVEATGLREWFEGLDDHVGRAAAFDTRIDAPAVLTGRAAKGIAKRLRRHGRELVAEPESFLVTKDSHLMAGETERARRWGAVLGASMAEATRPPAPAR